MDFSLTSQQIELRDQIARIAARFDDRYWTARDESAEFPEEFYRAIAGGGWLGIAMPEAFGGAGLGITEAAIMMRAIAESGAGMSGASAVHMNIFGLQPVVVFGTEAQKARMLPPLVEGKVKAAAIATSFAAKRSGFRRRRWRATSCCSHARRRSTR
jgi:acyl-CoA dehydrogenase